MSTIHMLVANGMILMLPMIASASKLAASEFPNERALGDGGYACDYEFIETPTGHNNLVKARAHTRHETLKSRFKIWGIS